MEELHEFLIKLNFRHSHRLFREDYILNNNGQIIISAMLKVTSILIYVFDRDNEKPVKFENINDLFVYLLSHRLFKMEKFPPQNI